MNCIECGGKTEEDGVRAWVCLECGVELYMDLRDDSVHIVGYRDDDSNESSYIYCCGIQHDSDELACQSCGDYF